MPASQVELSSNGGESIEQHQGEQSTSSRSESKFLKGDADSPASPPPIFGLEIERREDDAVIHVPKVDVDEDSTEVTPKLDPDASVQDLLLTKYNLDVHPSTLGRGGYPATSKASGSRVLVKRTLKSDSSGIDAINREILVRSATSDPSIARLHESLESDAATWAVIDYYPSQTLHAYITSAGPQSTIQTKSLATQLFSGIASIFLAGFAHLRICDQTILIGEGGRLTIDGFECAHPYGGHRVDGLTNSVQEKNGDDIYVAPEVFKEIRYNARKAVIWSCGVVLYFITTATTAPLATLNHPSFESNPNPNPNPSTTTIYPSQPTHSHSLSLPPNNNPVSITSTSTSTPPNLSPHKLRSKSTTSTPISSPHSRKLSTTHIPRPIPYPQNRHTLPSWLRDILSKMLLTNPYRRAELIEVAAKVPKEYVGRESRVLMEVAWLDYKWHVGPLAGLEKERMDREEGGGGGGGVVNGGGYRGERYGGDGEGGDAGSLFSSSGFSTFSGISAFSAASWRGLLSGRRRGSIATTTTTTTAAAAGGGGGMNGMGIGVGAGVGFDGGQASGRRRRSDWV